MNRRKREVTDGIVKYEVRRKEIKIKKGRC
jgi:hypothetical protein